MYRLPSRERIPARLVSRFKKIQPFITAIPIASNMQPATPNGSRMVVVNVRPVKTRNCLQKPTVFCVVIDSGGGRSNTGRIHCRLRPPARVVPCDLALHAALRVWIRAKDADSAWGDRLSYAAKSIKN